MSIPRDPENHNCSFCGEEDPDDYLTDVTVMIADGNEGFASVTQLLCVTCLMRCVDLFALLGFTDHRHGSINYLEDTNCCDGHQAFENCPTPTDYGNVIVQRK